MGFRVAKCDAKGLLPLDLDCPMTASVFCSEDVDDLYEVNHDPIARGKFASVRLARERRTGVLYALKYVRKRRRTVSLECEAQHEIGVLLLGRSDSHIIYMHQVYETKSEYIIVLEYGSGGDLQHLLDDRERFGENETKNILKQVLFGLRSLHTISISHLDIKPQNIVMMGVQPEEGVKLVDFGLSRVIDPGTDLTQIMGTPDYVAPEVINFEPVTLATDMWAIGVLAYVFLTGYTPFGGNTDQDTFVNITQGEFDFPDSLFSSVSEAAKDFISSLIIKLPSERLSVQEALDHPWLQCAAPSKASVQRDRTDSGYTTDLLYESHRIAERTEQPQRAKISTPCTKRKVRGDKKNGDELRAQLYDEANSRSYYTRSNTNVVDSFAPYSSNGQVVPRASSSTHIYPNVNQNMTRSQSIIGGTLFGPKPRSQERDRRTTHKPNHPDVRSTRNYNGDHFGSRSGRESNGHSTMPRQYQNGRKEHVTSQTNLGVRSDLSYSMFELPTMAEPPATPRTLAKNPKNKTKPSNLKFLLHQRMEDLKVSRNDLRIIEDECLVSRNTGQSSGGLYSTTTNAAMSSATRTGQRNKVKNRSLTSLHETEMENIAKPPDPYSSSRSSSRASKSGSNGSPKYATISRSGTSGTAFSPTEHVHENLNTIPRHLSPLVRQAITSLSHMNLYCPDRADPPKYRHETSADTRDSSLSQMLRGNSFHMSFRLPKTSKIKAKEASKYV